MAPKSDRFLLHAVACPFCYKVFLSSAPILSIPTHRARKMMNTVPTRLHWVDCDGSDYALSEKAEPPEHRSQTFVVRTNPLRIGPKSLHRAP